MAKIICKDLSGEKKFKRLTGKKRQIRGLRSGLVVLKPKESVGLHSTKNKEEVIIILKGKAKVFCEKKTKIVKENNFIYIPQKTEHNVENIGNILLKYVYVTCSYAIVEPEITN